MKNHLIMTEVFELKFFRRRDYRLTIMSFMKDTEGEDEDGVFLVNLLHGVISAFINVNDIFSEVRRSGRLRRFFREREISARGLTKERELGVWLFGHSVCIVEELNKLDKHLLEKAAFEGLGLGDLGGDAFDLAVDDGKKIGDFVLFVRGRNF